MPTAGQFAEENRVKRLSMAFQHYQPYRKDAVSNSRLRQLNELKPWIAMRDTAFAWVSILLTWIVVAHIQTWWSLAIAIPIIGIQYYSLLIIGHDGLHRRLFQSVPLNDLWSDLFIFGPIMCITRIHRHNHMNHHRETATEADPDRHKYTHAGKRTNSDYLLFLTGLPTLLPSLTNILSRNKNKQNTKSAATSHPGPTLRDVIILASWQIALLGGLTASIGWWAYPILWILPVYVFGYLADLLRVFCEHSMLSDDETADQSLRLISIQGNNIECAIFAPHNMNHHASHHLWPSIPYYNLPRATTLLRESKFADDIIWRRSYLGYLREYLNFSNSLNHTPKTASEPRIKCRNQ
ncbi:MAG: hypothetical protein C0507_12655 [Cyanobacteria bacterium PR.3.49]|nr:hypothetical protein [Cyanobacteria bacterium PR.3.49]